jgi:hypothetical protein
MNKQTNKQTDERTTEQKNERMKGLGGLGHTTALIWSSSTQGTHDTFGYTMAQF